MSAYIIPALLLTFIFNCFVTVIIVSKGLKNLVNFLFSILSLSVSAWIIMLLGYYSGLALNFNWLAGTHASALTIAITFYYFSIVFPKKISSSPIVFGGPFVLYSWVMYLLFFTDQVVGKSQGIAYEINSIYIFYEMTMLLFFFLGYYFLFKQYRRNNNRDERLQTLYILFGSFASSFLAMVTDLIFPALGIFSFTWLGSIFTVALVISIFIAIVKYRLFNIKIIATEALIFLLWAFLLIRTVVANNLPDQITNSILLVSTIVIGIFLIRSVVREVTQREHIEKLAKDLAKTNKDLEAANDKLKELDKQKTEFVSLASHQLRSPLTAIKGYSSMILEGDFGKITDKMKEAIGRIFESSQKLVLVIEDFLNITRIELGRIKFDMAEWSFNTLVKNVMAEQKPNIERRGLAISYEEDFSEYKVYADMGKISQVISNLIDNSVKYTKQGGIKVKVSGVKGDGPDRVRISVTDTGVGIEPETMSHLFQKFSRADDASATNIIGTGLGLYVAKQIMDAHQGKIWAESEGKDKGSTFYAELALSTGVAPIPVIPAPENPTAPAVPEPLPIPQPEARHIA